MSQASLLALAPELKIQIFKSMDSFSSVASLSSTSRTFHNLWKSDVKSICDAVLQRSIECLPEAQVLLDAKDSSQWPIDAQDLGTSQDGHGAFQRAIQRSHRLLVNADRALLAFEDFGYEMPDVSEPGRKVSPFERTSFVQAYYGAMTMVCLSCEQIPESLTASWHMLRFQRVRKVLYFLRKQFPFSLQEYRGIFPDSNWTLEGDIAIASHKMELLNHYFIAYEHLAKTTDSPGGVHLVELLRLVAEGTLRELWISNSLYDEVRDVGNGHPIE